MSSDYIRNKSTPTRQRGKLSQVVAQDITPRLKWLMGALLLQWPTMAWAIPGAGNFTSLDSPTGREMASLYNLLAIICLVIFIIVCIVMGAAIVLFRRKADDERPAQVHGNMKIEMSLLVAATLVQVFIGYKTVGTMWYVEKLPETQVTVEAIGYQWDWQFRYPEHGFVAEDLVIPAHTNVRLEITSKDVIHSLFIPELGVKMDAVPGRFNYWWVNADGPINQIRDERAVTTAARPNYVTTRTSPAIIKDTLNAFSLVEPVERTVTARGLEQKVTYLSASRKGQVGDDRYAKYDAIEYRGMCTELCGKGHYNMYFRVVAMTPASYNRWIQDMKSGGVVDAKLVAEIRAGLKYPAFPAGGAEPVPEQDLLSEGKKIYGSCESCHGADGKALPGLPNLTSSPMVLADPAALVTMLVKGQDDPKWPGSHSPMGQSMTDRELASLISYIRGKDLGNAASSVQPDEIARIRKSIK
jgi:cytochrome c oxidase subunit II